VKKAVFWDVAPCRYGVNRRFGGTYRLHLQGRREIIRKSAREASVREEETLHNHSCETLQSFLCYFISVLSYLIPLKFQHLFKCVSFFLSSFLFYILFYMPFLCWVNRFGEMVQFDLTLMQVECCIGKIRMKIKFSRLFLV
jgi:hypothetical protein